MAFFWCLCDEGEKENVTIAEGSNESLLVSRDSQREHAMGHRNSLKDAFPTRRGQRRPAPSIEETTYEWISRMVSVPSLAAVITWRPGRGT